MVTSLWYSQQPPHCHRDACLGNLRSVVNPETQMIHLKDTRVHITAWWFPPTLPAGPTFLSQAHKSSRVGPTSPHASFPATPPLTSVFQHWGLCTASSIVKSGFTQLIPCAQNVLPFSLLPCLSLPTHLVGRETFHVVGLSLTHALTHTIKQFGLAADSNPRIGTTYISLRASLVAQTVENLPAMWRPGFDSWVGKIPWRRAWPPTPVFLPGESHGQRSLVGYSPWDQRLRHEWAIKHTRVYIHISLKKPPLRAGIWLILFPISTYTTAGLFLLPVSAIPLNDS